MKPLKNYRKSFLAGMAIVILTALISLILLAAERFTPFVLVLLLPGLASMLFALVYDNMKR